jgi:hypothetical protein
MKKTKGNKMSCHSGDIPTRQEFVLPDRKKHYFRIEKANREGWDLMILEELFKADWADLGRISLALGSRP